MAARLNPELLAQLNEKITKRDVIRSIDDNYAGYADLAAVGAAAPPNQLLSVQTSIHVPVYKNAGQYNATDSCITIISLLNQWHLYTKTIIPNAAVGALPNGEAGILSGFVNGAGAAHLDMAPHLLALLFGGIQEAFDTVTALQAANVAGGNPFGGGGGAARYAALLIALGALPNGPAGVANANGYAPREIYGGWGRILNKIADYAGMPNLNTNETYTSQAGPAAPTVNAQPLPAAPITVGPTELIRYAFGLLYKIKVVLGTDWPDTHNQLSMGGRNSKNNNKRNKYTHRKKQYSQRRYKK